MTTNLAKPILWCLVWMLALVAACGDNLGAPKQLRIDPDSVRVEAGADATVTARYVDSADTVEGVVWTSSAPGVATVVGGAGGSAVVTGVSEGTATLTAQTESGQAQATITVTEASVVSLAITPPAPSLAAGTTTPLTATATLGDGTTRDVTADVTWTSATVAVATVGADGVLAGVTVGTSVITAAQGDVSATVTATVTAGNLVAIDITPPNPTLARGTSQQLTATGRFSDMTTQDLTSQVTWSSATLNNVTVSALGLATAVNPGTSVVTASMGAISGTTTVTVTTAVLTGIDVTPPNLSLADGLTRQMTAIGRFSDLTTQDLTGQVTWASSLPAVATVSATGLATALTPGTTSISATMGAISGATNLTVTAAALVSIVVTPTNPQIARGLTQQFTATGTFTDLTTANITATATWSSATPAVATISNAAGSQGRATGAGVGATVITATSGAISGTTTLTVTAATLVSIAVTPTNPSIARGLTRQFTATGTFTDLTTQNLTAAVTWTSATPATATISNAVGTEGLATSVAVGTSLITATSGAISGSTTLTVTAATLVSIAVTPTNPSIALGQTRQFTATGTFTDLTTQNLTTTATWTSGTPATATISNAAGSQGLATSAAAGTSVITATSGAISGTTTLTVTAATLVSIAVTPVTPSVADGLTQQFTATGTFTDLTTANITATATWASGTPATATISNAVGTRGLATAVNPGTTVITATSGAISGNTTMTVTAATLVSIAVTPVNPTIADGQTRQFTATGTFTDLTTQDLTATATWTSGTPATATISNAAGSQGLATSVDPGTTLITATSGAISGSTTLTVTAAVLVSIQVTPVNPTIADGQTRQFTATGTFTDLTTQNLTATATWTSGTPATATISNAAGTQGLATSVDPGTTLITATSGAISGSTTLTVTAATLVSIQVTPINPTLALGAVQQFTAIGTFTDASTQPLTATATWATGDATVLQVSNAAGSQGLATALAVGTTTITATSGLIVGQTTVVVTDATLVSIAVTPALPSIANGFTQPFTAIGTYSDLTTQTLTTTVTWASSAPAVAQISNAAGSQGLATSTGVGTTTISATMGAISGSTVLEVTPAVLVSIAVTPAAASIANGLTRQYTAIGTFSDATTQPLTTTATWGSGDGTVVQLSNAVGSEGLATAVGLGSTTVTATVGPIVGSTTVTVTAAVLVSIAVTPVNASIANGLTQPYTAVGTFSDLTTQPLTTTVTWASSAPAVAQISNAPGSEGLATSTGVGTTTISATLGPVSGSTTLNVTAATLVSIAVTPANASVARGRTLPFTAIGTYTDFTTQVLTTQATWSSSDPTFASVSNAAGSQGLATGLELGATTISATFDSVTGGTLLTVTAAELVSIAVTPPAPSINAGATVQLTATGTFSDLTTANITATVTWSTGAAAIATVNATGLVSGVGPGDAVITATSGLIVGSTTVTVTAAPPAVLSTVPADAATGVSALTSIAVTFNRAMLPASLTVQAGFGPCTGTIQVSHDDFASCIGLGPVVLSVGDTVATTAPGPALAFGAAYKIRVTTAALSSFGVALPATFTQPAGFTTAIDAHCATGLVISQVYGGGGNGSATFTHDFIELHNPTNAPIDLTARAVQYASATGSAWQVTLLPPVMLAPGAFFLIQEGSNAAVGAPLPPADVITAGAGAIMMAAGAGKVALTTSGAALTTTGCPTPATVTDFVGYGTTANCFEGAARAPVPSATLSVQRRSVGCADDGNNGTDYVTGLPAPRNTSSPINVCACATNESNAGGEADFCRLQHPPSTSVAVGGTTENIYGRIFETGVTEAGGANAVVRAQIGVGPTNVNPQNQAGFNWFTAAFNVQVGNDDEYQHALVSPAAPGTYRYTARFSLDGTNWTYCDLDGAGANDPGLTFDPARMGTLTVTP